MSRRDNAASRCLRCRLHASLCVCGLMPRLSTRTRLVLVVHRCEDRKTTNTGRIAAECLVNSEVLVRGHESHPSDRVEVPPGTRPLVLFPCDDALDLRDVARDPQPVTLVVPDGTWRQAAKVRQRVRGLEEARCVRLPPGGAPSRYRLRSESREDGLATMEAIARALGVLEGGWAEEALRSVFAAFVDRTLWARGLLATRDVHGGIPPGVVRHDPNSGEAPPVATSDELLVIPTT